MSGDDHRQPGPILGQIPHLPRSVQMHGSPSCTCLFCWDEIKRLRSALQLVVDQLEEGFPKSAQQFAMDALGEHLKEARRER